MKGAKMENFKTINDILYFLQHHNKNLTKKQEHAIDELAEKLQDLHAKISFLDGDIERGEKDLYSVSYKLNQAIDIMG